MELLERNVYSSAYLSFCHTGVPEWPLPMMSRTLLYSIRPGTPPATDIWWPSLETDLFKLVYLRTAPKWCLVLATEAHTVCKRVVHMLLECFLVSSNSGRTKISQTEAPTTDFRPKPVIWQSFCRKLHENERNWTRGRHVHLAHPWIGQWVGRY